jgi:hypothetical protein
MHYRATYFYPENPRIADLRLGPSPQVMQKSRLLGLTLIGHGLHGLLNFRLVP